MIADTTDKKKILEIKTVAKLSSKSKKSLKLTVILRANNTTACLK